MFPHIVDEPFFIENDRPLVVMLIAFNHVVKVRREGGQLALCSGHRMGQGQPHIGIVRPSSKTRSREGRATQCEEVIASRAVGGLAYRVLQQLLTREEILRCVFSYPAFRHTSGFHLYFRE